MTPATSPSPSPAAVEGDSSDGTGSGSQVAGLLQRPALLGGTGALLVLGAIALGVVLWRRGRSTSVPPPAPPGKPKPGPAGAAPSASTTVLAPVSLLVPAPPPAGVPYLQSEGRHPVIFCPLNRELIRVGRGPEQELQIDQTFPGWETVSREHATVTCKGDRCIVKDAGAPNGVRVDGRRTGQNVLLDGATVQFGQVAFTYHANRRGGVQ